MSDESATSRSGEPAARVYSYDSRTRLQSVEEWNGPAPTAEDLASQVLREMPTFGFQHDARNGVFRITWADGRVEVFRDPPVRYLVLEPDAETGELKPVVRCGRPWVLYLSREVHEVR
jgi:hypothetical protein